MGKVSVVVQLDRLCGAADCWCGHTATDKRDKPLPLKPRDVELEQVPAAIADVQLFGFRGHPAHAWIDASVVKPERARMRKPAIPLEPGKRLASCVRAPRVVRASSGEWRGERGTGHSDLGYRYERLTEVWTER